MPIHPARDLMPRSRWRRPAMPPTPARQSAEMMPAALPPTAPEAPARYAMSVMPTRCCAASAVVMPMPRVLPMLSRATANDSGVPR